MLKRLRVRKPPPYTGWTCVTLACCEIAFIVCLKKVENKLKERPMNKF